MEAIVQVVGVALLTVAGWVGFMLWRERHRRERNHSAEVAALARQQRAARFEDRTVEIGMFRNAEEVAAHRAHMWVMARRAFDEERDRQAARHWRTDYDALIADQDARWRALCERWDAQWPGLPAEVDDPTPVSPAPATTPTDVLPTLAKFDPTATLDMIRRDNAVPTFYSWSTQDLPLVPAGKGVLKITTRDRRRQRRIARYAANPLPR